MPWGIGFSFSRFLLLLGSRSRVNAWPPKSLSLHSLIVSLDALFSIKLELLTRAFGFLTFLLELSLEVNHHLLEDLYINNTKLGHMLLELAFFIVNLFFSSTIF